MNTEPIGSLGLRLTDVTVGPLESGTAATLANLLSTHGVLVLPDQDVDDDTFTAFLHSFGELTFTKGETPVEHHPQLNVVSNVGRSSPPRSNFHIDTTYVSHPPAYTALRAVQVPAGGGETVFSDQYAAYETLTPQLRDDLITRSVTHVVTGVTLEDDDESAAVHPLISRHPLSGRLALYLTTPPRCAAVSGLDASTGRELIERLYAHSTREDNLVAHRWSPGDVVIWDNRCVMHRADHASVDGDRVLHRGLVAPERVVGLGADHPR